MAGVCGDGGAGLEFDIVVWVDDPRSRAWVGVSQDGFRSFRGNFEQAKADLLATNAFMDANEAEDKVSSFCRARC